MNKKNITDKVLEAGNWLADTIFDAVEETKIRHEDELYNEGYEDGAANQKARDIKSTVGAFLELKVKEQEIFRLLSEYFGVDSIQEATEYIRKAKKTRQIIALRKYCEKEGMTGESFREFARSHHLEGRLSDDERLLDMQPDKLKAIIDKN